jgi:hypothetical protein
MPSFEGSQYIEHCEAARGSTGRSKSKSRPKSGGTKKKQAAAGKKSAAVARKPRGRK